MLGHMVSLGHLNRLLYRPLCHGSLPRWSEFRLPSRYHPCRPHTLVARHVSGLLCVNPSTSSTVRILAGFLTLVFTFGYLLFADCSGISRWWLSVTRQVVQPLVASFTLTLTWLHSATLTSVTVCGWSWHSCLLPSLPCHWDGHCVLIAQLVTQLWC